MQTMQINQTAPDSTKHIIRLLELHGVKIDQRSYTTKATAILPTMNPAFTVPALARRAGIPRSKGYPTIKELQKLHLVKPVDKMQRPEDWADYTRSMRKRFNRQNGLPMRGVEPQRYTYTPLEALRFLRVEISDQIHMVDQLALNQIKKITTEYAAIERGLSSHPS